MSVNQPAGGHMNKRTYVLRLSEQDWETLEQLRVHYGLTTKAAVIRQVFNNAAKRVIKK